MCGEFFIHIQYSRKDYIKWRTHTHFCKTLSLPTLWTYGPDVPQSYIFHSSDAAHFLICRVKQTNWTLTVEHQGGNKDSQAEKNSQSLRFTAVWIRQVFFPKSSSSKTTSTHFYPPQREIVQISSILPEQLSEWCDASC